MSRPKREEVGYKYPDECCGLCEYSFQNAYGDKQCKVLYETDNVIDIGGWCTEYKKEDMEVH